MRLFFSLLLIAVVSESVFAAAPICSGFFEKGQNQEIVIQNGYQKGRVVFGKRGKLLIGVSHKGSERLHDIPMKYQSLVKGERFVEVKFDGKGRVEHINNPNLEIKHTDGRIIRDYGVKYLEFVYSGFNERVEIETRIPVGHYVKIKVVPKEAEHQYDAYKAVIVEDYGLKLPAKNDPERLYGVFGIDITYPEAVLKQARQIIDDFSISKLLRGNRKDYRDLEFITIDGPTTIDRDDAIHVRKLNNGNFLLQVAVPDLASHIPLGSPIANHMTMHSTSHYLKGRTWHLLPEELSSKVLSIDPHQERAAVVYEMEITPAAEVVKYNVTDAVIRSRGAFTYEEIQKDMDLFNKKDKSYFSEIYELYALVKERGNKYLSLPVSFEREITIDKEGEPYSITEFNGLEANLLIEKFMILTNVESAKWMIERKIPAVFRGQEKPQEGRLVDAARVLRALDVEFHLNKKDSLYVKFRDALKAIEDSHYVKPLASMLLQATTTAVNSIQASEHFFLNTRHYAFMTSPLRRSSDFWNQHLIKRYFEEQNPVFAKDPDLRAQAKSLASRQNQNMRRQKQSEYKMTAIKLFRLWGDELYKKKFEALYIEKGREKPMVWIEELGIYAELEAQQPPRALVKHMRVKVIDFSLITGEIRVKALRR